MLGGGSDGAHDAPDYGEKQAIFMQFAGKERAQSLHLVYRAAAVTRRAGGRRRAVAVVAAVHPAAEVAGRAGCEEQHREAAEHEQRHRHRGGPGGVRRGTTVAVVSVSTVVVGRVVSWSSSSWSSCSCSVVVVVGLGRRRRARRGVAAARVGLALLRERERAADLFLRVRVVEDVRRKLRDRLACSSGADRSCRPGRRRTSRR